MRFSRALKSSKHCLPSPDGRLVATLLPSAISIRAVGSLEVVHVSKLPPELQPAAVISFQWSPSSRHVLVASAEHIRVLSALDGSFQASLRNATPPGAKPSCVAFGPSGTEVWVWSSFGLRLGIYDLKKTATAAVEVANPKFFSAATARRGLSCRPRTQHLALLTRAGGKDMISIHDPATRAVRRAWHPDTVDAQGLEWSPDGRWLLVWEAPGLGHRVIFYTPDGHVFKVWLGPADPGIGPGPDQQQQQHLLALGAGVKLVRFSADAQRLVVGDSSRCLYLFDMASVSETLRLVHPDTIVPADTVQVWQEQVEPSLPSSSADRHTFVRAAQAVSPRTRTAREISAEAAAPRTGCASVQFDSSSLLAATCLEESPGAVWIWDTQASELRAVLLFHAAVSSIEWHPTARETLLTRCEGAAYAGLAFVWDPLSGGPRTVDFGEHLADFRPDSRTLATWLEREPAGPPSLFFSDGAQCILASLAESDEESPPWTDRSAATGWSDGIRRGGTLSELVSTVDGDLSDGDASELEDTFYFKQ